jgi:hypothetical protein
MIILTIPLSAATRFEVSKLVAQTLVQSLVKTTSRTHTFGIIRLMNSLILDNDRASSLFGAEGAIAPLIATMVSSTSDALPVRDSAEIAAQSDTWNIQTAAATALACVASCNGAFFVFVFPRPFCSFVSLQQKTRNKSPMRMESVLVSCSLVSPSVAARSYSSPC